MKRHRFIHKWESPVKKIFLTSTTLWLASSLMLMSAVSPSQAEIYRWKDEKGVIRYSNAPPKGESKEVLDVIPTRRVPLVEDADGTVYYLNLPDSELTQDMSFQDVLDQLTLPADVLDELMEEASAKAKAANAEPLSTVTFRLAELEEALEREISKRLEWEQEYLKSLSHSEKLEQRNDQLQLALVDMEDKIGKVQKAVALSEIHASALQEPQQQLEQLESRLDRLQTALTEQDSEQEIGQLAGKIVQLQAYLTEMSRQSDEEAAELISTMDRTQEQQSVQLASLSGRLDQLELGVNSFQEQSVAEKFSELSREMQELKASLPQGYDDSQLQARLRELQSAQKQQLGDLGMKLQELESLKATYEQSMEALSEKLGALETSMDALDDSTLQAKVEALAERVAAFEQQPQDETVHVKLAALETAIESLTDAVPVSRDTSTLVAELFESRERLEAVSEEQAEQIRIQREQIAMLRDELEQLKVRSHEPQKTAQEVPAADPETMTALREKNAQMEDVIQQQAGALTLQQERLAAIESRLERSLEKSENPAVDDELPEEMKSPSKNRISVVERQYRRGAKKTTKPGVYVLTK